LPNYIKLGDELVIIVEVLNKKRSGKGTATQVYYKIEDGRCYHASRFRKMSIADLKVINRDNKLKQLL
jgi:hypothetical protein